MVAWQIACRDVEDGNVGLKDLATLNSALLLKHVHKLFSKESNPCVDWVRQPLCGLGAALVRRRVC